MCDQETCPPPTPGLLVAGGTLALPDEPARGRGPLGEGGVSAQLALCLSGPCRQLERPAEGGIQIATSKQATQGAVASATTSLSRFNLRTRELRRNKGRLGQRKKPSGESCVPGPSRGGAPEGAPRGSAPSPA